MSAALGHAGGRPRGYTPGERVFRRKVAAIAAAWSMAVTMVGLVVVGAMVFDGGATVFDGGAIEARDASLAARGGPLREALGDRLRPVVEDRAGELQDEYRDRAIVGALLAVSLVGAGSAAAGWWFAGLQLRWAEERSSPRRYAGSKPPG